MADNKKCIALDHPSLMPSWGCCGCKTMNGNQRSNCKYCDHARCDNPAVIKVPVQEESGIRIVHVQVKTDKANSN